MARTRLPRIALASSWTMVSNFASRSPKAQPTRAAGWKRRPLAPRRTKTPCGAWPEDRLGASGTAPSNRTPSAATRSMLMSRSVCRAEAAQLLGRFRGRGVELQQALELLDGELVLAGLRVDLRQVLGGEAAARVQLDGAAELSQRGAASARVGGRLAKQRPAQRGAVFGLVGHEARRLAESLDGFVVAAAAQVLEARLVQSARRG